MNAKTYSSEDHYVRLGGLETRMQHLEDTVSGFSKKLDAITTAVSGINANPKFDPLRILQFIALAVAIATAGGTVITYVATSTNSARIAVIEFKSDNIWSAGRWNIDGRNVTRAIKSDSLAQ